MNFDAYPLKYNVFNTAMKTKLLFIILLFSYVTASAQGRKDTVRLRDGSVFFIIPYEEINGEKVPMVSLNPITIYPKHVFKSKKDLKQWNKMVYNVKKVYPYSQIVKYKLYHYNYELSKLKTEREKDKYLKIAEKDLKKNFEGAVRNMTYTQGRILIKLIDRETGQTTYKIVKDLKGSLTAFFWQSVAVLFSSSLKYEYDAEGNDKLIEEIVVQIENGLL